MEQINHTTFEEVALSVNTESDEKIIMDVTQMPDIVLKRLMEEVKNDNANQMFAYDRAHNRHNRGR